MLEVANRLRFLGKHLLNIQHAGQVQIGSTSSSLQVRFLQLWPDWRMKKDVRKRKALEDNYGLKLRLNAMRRTKVLPPELRELASEDFHKMLPNDVKGLKTVPRCVITSRPRGNVLRWRLSRIMFRHLADYNKMAGIQRAMW
ncbi:28S ribosomal protein S14, mitochondrial [Homalodisca vitripennis]|nr:28S ribosomal protein S14, mitochondrial [Homalodisca vitripennis]